jgi:hypothetical protein
MDLARGSRTAARLFPGFEYARYEVCDLLERPLTAPGESPLSPRYPANQPYTCGCAPSSSSPSASPSAGSDAAWTDNTIKHDSSNCGSYRCGYDPRQAKGLS